MASMADRTDPHAGESMAGPHGAPDDHGADHGHDDHGTGEGHGSEALGPVDVPRWGAAALGIVLGLVIVVAFLGAAS
jgi:hypothetical protein